MPLNLRHQVRFLYVAQFDFQLLRSRFSRTRFLPLLAQIQEQAAFMETFQSSFEMPVAVYWVPSRQLHSVSGEAFEIRRAKQLAIQSRRRKFYRVRISRHDIFYVYDRPYFPAEVRAILVRDAGGFINHDTEHPGLSSAAQL